MSRTRLQATRITLRGHASCMAKGLSVAQFFWLLNSLGMDFTIDLDLYGDRTPTLCSHELLQKLQAAEHMLADNKQAAVLAEQRLPWNLIG